MEKVYGPLTTTVVPIFPDITTNIGTLPVNLLRSFPFVRTPPFFFVRFVLGLGKGNGSWGSRRTIRIIVATVRTLYGTFLPRTYTLPTTATTAPV